MPRLNALPRWMIRSLESANSEVPTPSRAPTRSNRVSVELPAGMRRRLSSPDNSLILSSTCGDGAGTDIVRARVAQNPGKRVLHVKAPTRYPRVHVRNLVGAYSNRNPLWLWATCGYIPTLTLLLQRLL